jgi:type IV pilus assembly protein PilM
MKSENPKAVFQAMRPVFSDLVAEIQRSIGFFTSNNRNAKLGEMIALGNPMKLPGLQRFLSQNLDQQVKLVDQFNHLVGGTAAAGPQFKDNQLTFGVSYGLCVQALDRAQLRTNLLPDEIITTRLVRAKKPWAVAAVALLLVGLTINYFAHYAALRTANVTDPAMSAALNKAKSIAGDVAKATEENTNLVSRFDQVVTTAQNLQTNVDGRLLWLELLKAIDAALPKDRRPPDQRQETEEDIAQRLELHIEGIECEYFPDLSPWQNSFMKYYTPAAKPEAPKPPAGAPADPNAAPPVEGQPPDAAATAGITPEVPPVDPASAPPVDPNAATGDPNAAAATGNSGWVIELRGYHLHNHLLDKKVNVGDEGERFVRNTFLKELELGAVKLPDGPDGKLIDVPIAELGIKYPVVVTSERTYPVTYFAESPENVSGMSNIAGPEGAYLQPGGIAQPGGVGQVEPPKTFKLRKYRFVVQFVWQPQPRGQRLEKMAQKKAAAPSTAAAADAGTAAAGT